MTCYLLDTNVISLVAPAQRRTDADAELAAWIEDHGDNLRLSVITAAEIHARIEKARRTGAIQKAATLDQWWSGIMHVWGAHILPFDIETATETGRLMDLARSAGFEPGFEDAAIAATASVNDMTMLTRNAKHFQPMGVSFVNPFERLPSD